MPLRPLQIRAAFLFSALLVLVLSPLRLDAQCVSLTTLGSASTQNFDTLSNTAGSTTNNLTIPGWFMTETGGGARDNEQYAVDTGASTTGDTYSYGAAASPERAIGNLRSGTLISVVGACFTNNTGATIGNLAVAYNGEEWRLGTAGRADQLNFEYSTDSTDLVTGTWTNVSALNFVSPDTVTAGAKNGNAAADRTALSSTISSLSILNGATFWIRWTDIDATGADDGLAVDDFSLTPGVSIPANNLTINDVSLNEGNAGTTSFTFTVSLSAPAGPGGVTFDIATADGTAIAPGDYTSKSFAGQTIPAGSSTYSFTVLVNGDTTPETNETFSVNVTNVTGATVTDGQGQGTIVNDDAAPNLTINDVSVNEGNAGTTAFTFTVSLSAPAGPGGVTFDIATADGTATAPGDYTSKSLNSQTIPAGSSTYSFTVLVNGDTTPETDETFLVNVTNATNAIVTDSQGLGTIVNDDITKIHDVQGNGTATPIPGATVTVEGVVVGNYQGTNSLQGFFLQEEDADVDADPNTSEGVFIFCGACVTPVAEGQRVKATGSVGELNGLTEITAATAGSVVVTDAGNHLAEVTPSSISLPIAGPVDDYYERLEGMLVTVSGALTVADNSALAPFGQVALFQGGRPSAFTEGSAPGSAGYATYLSSLDARRVLLDDRDNALNSYLTQPDGFQVVYHPQANGGFSVGTQGADFFRDGDLVNGLTGVLDFSAPGVGSASWRVRPTAAHPVQFTVANSRPAAAPGVGGAIHAASLDLGNYFTTIDTTSSTTSGPCGPLGTRDCAGADSVAELNRQRERVSIVVCDINADVFGLLNLENTTPSASITDLLGAVNLRCGGSHPYAFINTGGTLGGGLVRVQMIYRTGILSPVGAPLVDTDPAHDFPPTAQTFDVVDAANPAFGQRFTAITVAFKSRTCDAGATGADADAGDGQACYNGRRTSQATRLLTWINGTVVPAAGDPDVLIVGNLNAYAQETPATTLLSGGFTDLAATFLGSAAYSAVDAGAIAHPDVVLASASLLGSVTGANYWHINADEADLFDYNDEVRDTGEAAGEEKPDGSALLPPRVVFQPGLPYRESAHDAALVGLFQVSDLAVTKTDTPDPVDAGTSLTYTIDIANNGPDSATGASWSDTLPAGTTFVSMPAVAGWSCTTPAVGAGGTVSCSNSSFAVGDSSFTLTVAVAPSVVAGTVLSNTATASSSSADGNTANNSASATTTVGASANLSVTKADNPDPVTAGNNLTYAITATNAGPSNAAAVSLSDTLPAGTAFVSLSYPGGWSCTTPAVGSGGTVTCSISSFGAGSAAFTLVASVNPATAAGTVLSNTATITSTTTDPAPGNESATATTTVAASADLSVTKVDTPDPVTAGTDLTYTITVANAGPSDAAAVSLSDPLPAGTSFVSLSSPGGWSCTTPAIGAGGTVTCSNASLAIGSASFTLVVSVSPATAAGTVLTNMATVSSSTTDPALWNQTGEATTTTAAAADLSVTKLDTPDPVTAGADLTYTITVTNAGPSNATTVILSDPLPAGTSFVSLSSPGGWSCTTPAVGAAGTVSCSDPSLAPASAVFTLVVSVSPTTAGGTVLSNTATVSSTTTDPTPGNENGTATTTVATAADLSVTKIDTPDPVIAGNDLTYTITVANAGPSNAASVSLTDTLPTNTTFVSLSSPGGWSCATPAVGASGTVTCTDASLISGSAVFTLTVAVDSSTAAATVITNTATVSSATSDPNPGNESATATTTVGAVIADLSITLSDSPDPVNAGAPLTYAIHVTNGGPGSALGVSVTDALPAGTTFSSLSSPVGWSCTVPAVGANGSILCTTATLSSGSADFALVVTASPAVPPATILTDTAVVAAASTDPTPGDESATTTTTVLSPASVTATKTVAGTFTPGGAVTYTIVLSNSGPSAQADNPGPELSDVLPSSLLLVSASASSGTAVATTGTNTVTWDGSIPAGGSVTITIHATLKPSDTPGTSVSNQATISYDADGNGTNESTAVTDDPGQSGSGNATTFAVAAPVPVATDDIPTLDPSALLALIAILAALGAGLMRGRS